MGTNFSITRQSGFTLTFANGYTVSVQFGPLMYCGTNRSEPLDAPSKTDDWNSRLAEVAVIDPNGEFVKLGEHDDVLGWQSPDKVASIITHYSSDSIS